MNIQTALAIAIAVETRTSTASLEDLEAAGLVLAAHGFRDYSADLLALHDQECADNDAWLEHMEREALYRSGLI